MINLANQYISASNLCKELIEDKKYYKYITGGHKHHAVFLSIPTYISAYNLGIPIINFMLDTLGNDLHILRYMRHGKNIEIWETDIDSYNDKFSWRKIKEYYPKLDPDSFPADSYIDFYVDIKNRVVKIYDEYKYG